MKNKKFFSEKKFIIDIVLILIIFGLVIYFARPLFNFLAEKQFVADYIKSYGALGPLILMGLEAFQEMIIGLPGINTISGYIFGPVMGTVYSILGGTFGTVIAFYLARLLGRPIIERFVSKRRLDKFDGFIQKRSGLFILFLMFLIPFLPDTLACYAAGLSPLSLPIFIIVALLGRFPPVLVAVLLGSEVKTGYSTRLLIYIIVVGLFLAILYLMRNKIEKYLLKRK
jgi:uncharacterized membrane protein YdjX (TVP38/TMEM64 family)